MRLTHFITFGAGAMIALTIAFSIASYLIGDAADKASYAAMTGNAALLVADSAEAGSAAAAQGDPAAARQALDQQRALVDAHRKEAQALEGLRAGVTNTGNVIIVFAIVFMAWFTRRQFGHLNKVASVAGDIAGGKYDGPTLAGSFWQEVAHLHRSIGVFRENGLAMVELSADREADLERDRAERELRDALQTEVARVVAAAAEGDFSARIDTRYDRPDLDRLAEDLNALMAGVECGVTEIGETLDAIARDDLTRRVNSDFCGAFDRLKSNTNSVADRLVDIIGRLRDTSGILKSAAAEILGGSHDLGDRTGRQASIVAETADAMTQIADTVSGNAEKAGEVHRKSSAMSSTAEEGGAVMREANQAMERISASSAKISNIIGLIDHIAFQTNLLALNASVEAARAGEAGKGFAVVAVEVRRLAQSAAEASSEIKELIQQSAGEVTTGTQLVGDAAERLLSMLSVMAENTTDISAISTDSREQAHAIGEVDGAIRELEKMTQNNAALAEQTTRAIEQMDRQVAEMEALVGVFRLERTEVRNRAAASRAA